jgi:catechol 2,3-dioxygenase-like lactoylglutathione lyase family enzyme
MSKIHGFSHVGVSTHDMDATIRFYEGVLGLGRVAENLTTVRSGGSLRQVYFSLGGAFPRTMTRASTKGLEYPEGCTTSRSELRRSRTSSRDGEVLKHMG